MLDIYGSNSILCYIILYRYYILYYIRKCGSLPTMLTSQTIVKTSFGIHVAALYHENKVLRQFSVWQRATQANRWLSQQMDRGLHLEYYLNEVFASS